MEHIKEKKSNVACLIMQVTLSEDAVDLQISGHGGVINVSRYDDLADNTISSIKKFHPEIDLHYVTDENINDYIRLYFKEFEWLNALGINRYALAYELMKQYEYEKIIILGCDTIVCSKLDEFMDNNQDDVLATLNYPIQEETEYWKTPIIEVETPQGKVFEHLNINADVACFNNVEALKKVVELSIEHFTLFSEQGGLNELAHVDKSFNVKIVDSPYCMSDVSYNVRAKGVPRCDMIENGLVVNCHLHGFSPEFNGKPSPTKYWYVKDDKLFTHDHKQIKVFHFIEGLSGRTEEKFNQLMDDFRYNWFNEETLKFFREVCGCTRFFKDKNNG